MRPRVADIDAPLLVVLLGPTGAGRSSLLNTIARAEVSKAGVLRPTTKDAVLYASKSDSYGILASGRLAAVAKERPNRVPGAWQLTVATAPQLIVAAVKQYAGLP